MSKNAPHLVMVSRNATRSPENPVARFQGSLAIKSPNKTASRSPGNFVARFLDRAAPWFQGKLASRFLENNANRSPGKTVVVFQGITARVFLYRSKLQGKSVLKAAIINCAYFSEYKNR